MKRIYNKTTWVDNKTQINAERLNNIENGISGLYSDALSLSNLQGSDGIMISALEGGDVKFSWTLNKLSSKPVSGLEGTLGDYYLDEDSGDLYFCFGPGEWIILKYDKFVGE